MPLSTEQLTLGGPVEAATIDIIPAAFEARRVALAAAKVCREVRDADSVKDAAAALVAVKALLKQTEASRTLVKAPVLAASRAIDETCKNFVADLVTEEKRLNALIGTYQAAEQQKALAARLEAERQERLIREEQEKRERDRLAAARAGETKHLESDMDEIAQEANQAALEVRQAAIAQAEATAAPEGISVRKNWKFEVVDVRRLFVAHPDLCTIEPNNAAIRAIIKNRQDIPGLRIWAEHAAVVGAKATSTVPTAVAAYDY
jgi:hypothetical protein